MSTCYLLAKFGFDTAENGPPPPRTDRIKFGDMGYGTPLPPAGSTGAISSAQEKEETTVTLTPVSAQPADQSLDATRRKLDAELESFVGAPAPKKRPLSTAAGSHSPAKRPTTGAGVQQKSSLIADMESQGYSKEKIAEMVAMGLE